MAMINDTIKSYAIKHYTYFHKHPELSFNEKDTSAYVKKTLEQEEISFETAGNTDIMASIKGIRIPCHLATQAAFTFLISKHI